MFIRITRAAMAARSGLSRFINLVIRLSVSLVVWDRRCCVLLSWASGPHTSGGRHISSVFMLLGTVTIQQDDIDVLVVGCRDKSRFTLVEMVSCASTGAEDVSSIYGESRPSW